MARTAEQQPAVARAAEQLIDKQRDRMEADGEVLTTDDGLRVVLLWRWQGSRRPRHGLRPRSARGTSDLCGHARCRSSALPHRERCVTVGTRILIVDDDPRFRALARTLLERLGYVTAAEAADGAQALAAARRVRPDAALVDVQLPDIDGLALGRRLREMDGSLRIVLTSTDPTLSLPPRSPTAERWRSSPRTSSRSPTSHRCSATERTRTTGKPHAHSSGRPTPAARCRAYGRAMLNPRITSAWLDE